MRRIRALPQVATLICKLLRALQTTLVALLRIPGCLTQATQSKRSAEPWPSSAASLWAVPLMYRRALEWSSRPAPCRLSTRRDDAPHGAANLRVVVDATTLGNRQRVNPVLDSVSHSKQFTSSYPSHKWQPNRVQITIAAVHAVLSCSFVRPCSQQLK